LRCGVVEREVMACAALWAAAYGARASRDVLIARTKRRPKFPACVNLLSAVGGQECPPHTGCGFAGISRTRMSIRLGRRRHVESDAVVIVQLLRCRKVEVGYRDLAGMTGC